MKEIDRARDRKRRTRRRLLKANALPKQTINDVIVYALNHYRKLFLETKKQVKNAADSDEEKRLEELAKKYWWQMIQLLPSSYNQKRTVQLNYEVLANIYQYRKNHKLDEWRDFCEWIEQLPYSEIITGPLEGVKTNA